MCISLYSYILTPLFDVYWSLWQGESFKFLVQQKYLGYVCILVVRCRTCHTSTRRIANTRDICKRHIAKRQDTSNTKIAKREETSLNQTYRNILRIHKYSCRSMHVETLVHPRRELPRRRICQGNGKDKCRYKTCLLVARQVTRQDWRHVWLQHLTQDKSPCNTCNQTCEKRDCRSRVSYISRRVWYVSSQRRVWYVTHTWYVCLASSHRWEH